MAEEQKVEESHESYVTVTQGMSGWFAVLMWWAPENGGFWEPWNTGFGRYPTKDQAVKEAREWARDEELEFRE